MMKKLLILLLFPSIIFPQDKFSKLNKNTMETSILYDRVYKTANLTETPKEINASYFIQAYSELSKADYNSNFNNVSIFKTIKDDSFKEQFIPLGILKVDFETIKTNAITDGLISIGANNNLINTNDGAQSIFDKHNITIVSPVIRKFKGLKTKFKILPELITNTSTNGISSIKANFNNGFGFQVLNINEEILVNYPTEGIKHIDFEITFTNGIVKNNRASIVIQKSSTDLNADNLRAAPGDEGPITSINSLISYQGEGETQAHLGTAEYKIFYDNVDGVLDKPIIFVDGFDPGDDRTIPLMYNLLNFGNPTQNLADLVRDEGYDLVVLNFPIYTSASDGSTVIDGGADFIQRNAYILANLINTINGLKVGSEENVVIGPSMGGLISRYALRYMEQNTMNHETRLYLSFDSPHLGANVPIGIQYMFNYMVNGDPGITAAAPLVDGLLNSAAAKQMLIDHYLGHLQNGSNFLQDNSLTLPTGAPNFRDAFQNELETMGFPQNTRNVSIINGSGIGALTGSPGASIINHTFDTGVQGGFPTQAIISTNFTPAASQTITITDFVGQVNIGFWLTAFSFSATAESPSFSDGIDSAPGGLFDLTSFDDGSDPLIAEFVANLNIDAFNFIPSVSALALDNTNSNIDWYHDIDLGPGDPPGGDVINSTSFVNWYIPDTNEDHVLLTEANVAFALTEIIPETLSSNELENNIIKLEKNPVTNQIILLNNTQIQNAAIKIIDVTGKTVYQNNNLDINNRTSIPINLNSGLYILKVIHHTNSFTTKFIVN
ncbi:T9SS type A sorting domain-containing protein [Pontimicrobium sp. IMCC45349]|uniref:T9SS type A sorting domain-containing protein n=1 Tax=Pontimicrobium sp. IMCC45349 TaxID=3391574 RepID=UPI0039A3AC9E